MNEKSTDGAEAYNMDKMRVCNSWKRYIPDVTQHLAGLEATGLESEADPRFSVR